MPELLLHPYPDETEKDKDDSLSKHPIRKEWKEWNILRVMCLNLRIAEYLQLALSQQSL